MIVVPAGAESTELPGVLLFMPAVGQSIALGALLLRCLFLHALFTFLSGDQLTHSTF